MSGIKISETSKAGEGVYTAQLTGTTAGQVTIVPQVNGTAVSGLSASITLTADASTARFADGKLTVLSNDAIANGSATNRVQVTVIDASDNPVSGVTVSFSADNGATLFATDVPSGDDGTATTAITSTTAGIANVTAKAGAAQATDTVTFVADTSTARIIDTDLIVNKGAIADGQAQNLVIARVTDENNNIVTGATVTLTVSDAVTADRTTAESDDTGRVGFYLTSVTPGTYPVSAKVNGAGPSKETTFNPDTTTALVRSLTIDTNDAVANGSDTNTATAVVKDARGTPIAGIQVEFSVTGSVPSGMNPPATIGKVLTDENGIAKTSVTSHVAGTFTLQAMATGTAATEEAEVRFVAGDVVASESTLTASPLTIKADQTDSSLLTFTANDANGNPVTGLNVSWSQNGVTADIAAVSAADGVYTARLTGKTAGQLTVTPQVNGAAVGGLSQTVTLTADSSTAVISQFVMKTDNAVADGTATNSVAVTVTDAQNNPVEGATVTFTADNSARLAASSATSGTDGTATTTLTSTVAGTVSVGAAVNGTDATPVSLTFVAGDVAASESAFTASPLTLTADGVSQSTLTFTAKDTNGNAVTDLSTVGFTKTGTAAVAATIGTVQHTGNGVYTAQLTGTSAGQVTVTPQVNNSNVGSLSQTITLEADSNSATFDGQLEVLDNNIVADNSATGRVQVRVVDSNSNPVSGVTVSFSTGNAAATATPQVVTVENGIATAEVKSSAAGVMTITASLGSKNVSGEMTFIAGALDATQTTFTAAPATITADGTTQSVLTLTAKDAFGNVITDLTTVSFTKTGAAADGATVSPAQHTGNGVYTAQLTGKTAGEVTLTPQVDGSNVGNLSQTVTLTADSSTAVISQFVMKTDGAVADGTATNSVQVTVTDTQNNPVENATVTFTADNSAQLASTTATTGADGTVTMTLTNTASGTVAVGAAVNGTNADPVSVRFVADQSTAHITLLQLGEVTSPAAGDTVRYTATAMDANNNLLTDADFDVAVTGSADASVLPVNNGVATVSVIDTVAEAITLTVSLKGNDSVSAQDNLTFTAAALDADQSAFTAEPATITADGTSQSVLSLTAKDTHGNAITDLTTVSFAKAGVAADKADITPVQHTGNGIYTAQLTGKTAGEVTLTPQVDGSNVGNLSQTVTLTADSSTATVSSLTTDRDTLVASGTDSAQVEAVVTDANGNPVAGTEVTFSADNGATAEHTTLQTGEDGKAVTTLTSTIAGLSTVTAKAGTSEKTAEVTFTADTTTAQILEGSLKVTTDEAVADGTATNAVEVKVVDANNNPVKDVSVGFTTGGKGVLASDTATTDETGTAVMTLTSTVVGENTVTASLNGTTTGPVSVSFVIDMSTLKVTINTGAQEFIAGPVTAVDFIVEDENGNALPELSYEDLDLSVNSLSGTAVIKNSGFAVTEGRIVTTILDARVAEDVTVHVALKSSPDVNAEKTMTFTALDSVNDSNSTFTVTPDTITADGTDAATLTIVTRDMYGNLIEDPSEAISFTSYADESDAEAVEGMKISEVSKTAPGTFTATLTGTKSGNIKVRPVAGERELTYQGKTVTVVADDGMEEMQGTILAKGHTFRTDEGFPTTAVFGNSFTFNEDNFTKFGTTVDDYEWSTSSGEVNVPGRWVFVQMTSDLVAANGNIEIIATPKENVSSKTLVYRFKLKQFISGSSMNGIGHTYESAQSCSKYNGFVMHPAPSNAFTNATANKPQVTREVGTVWGEWGDPNYTGINYGSSWGTNTMDYWTGDEGRDENGKTTYIMVNQADGTLLQVSDGELRGRQACAYTF